MRTTRYEVSTYGFDRDLQGIGNGPNGPYNVGLRVPGLPTTAGRRYLFLLARASFGKGRRARLIGMRQLLTMFATTNSGAQGAADYTVEKEITSPFWHPSDATVQWSVRKILPTERPTGNVHNAEGLMFLDSSTPALLYQNAPADAGGYLAPNGEQPWGTTLTEALGCLYDLRFPWRDDRAAGSIGVEFEGPCDIGLFALVKQTDPATRTRITLPVNASNLIGSALSEEDQFVATFTDAMYSRIAGSLIFEEDDVHGHCRDENDGEVVRPPRLWTPPSPMPGPAPDPEPGPPPPPVGTR